MADLRKACLRQVLAITEPRRCCLLDAGRPSPASDGLCSGTLQRMFGSLKAHALRARHLVGSLPAIVDTYAIRNRFSKLQPQDVERIGRTVMFQTISRRVPSYHAIRGGVRGRVSRWEAPSRKLS